MCGGGAETRLISQIFTCRLRRQSATWKRECDGVKTETTKKLHPGPAVVYARAFDPEAG